MPRLNLPESAAKKGESGCDILSSFDVLLTTCVRTAVYIDGAAAETLVHITTVTNVHMHPAAGWQSKHLDV